VGVICRPALEHARNDQEAKVSRSIVARHPAAKPQAAVNGSHRVTPQASRRRGTLG
jgi:hypothetical protein